jgi:hypothetical protein
MPDMHELHGVVECLFCKDREVVPEVSLHELGAMIRARGYRGKLNEAGDAIAAICPTCDVSDCPGCGQPVNQHRIEDGTVVCCDGSRPG